MKKTKRFIAMLMSALMVMGAFFITPAAASAADMKVSMQNTGWDEGRAANLWNGGSVSGGDDFYILYTSPDTMLYCLEPGAPLSSGEDMNINSYVNKLHTPSISGDMIVSTLLGRLFQYIDYEKTGSPLSTNDGKALYIAARVLTWEVTQGERDEDFNYVAPPSGYDRVLKVVSNSTMPDSYKDKIMDHYNYLVGKVKNHHKIPSFTRMSQSNAPTHELAESGGVLSVTLTDNNGVMGGYSFSGGANLSFSKNGNKLTVSAPGGFDGEAMVTAASTNIQRRGVVCYGDGAGGRQDTVSVGSPIDDPMRAYFKVKAAYGNLSVIKTTKNNDGIVGGFQFEVKRGETNIGTFTSAADGRISIPNLKAGTYTVREVNLSDEFVQPTPNPVTVEIKPGQTTAVNFGNVKKLGVITVQKSNANPVMGDYSLAGAEFAVKDANGNTVDTIITGANGKGESKPLRLGTYSVQESKAPWGLVRDKNVYYRTLSGNLGVSEIVYCPEIPVPERPQTGQVRITKLDTETGAAAQGDATLAGAVFDLLDAGGNLVERIYCGKSTLATSKEVKLGSYVVREVTPPRGYTLAQKDYPVQIDYAGQEVEINLVSTEVKNTVIKGKIQLVKHSDDPDPDTDPENEQVQKPLEGIVFDIHLKSAGSYENAKPTERDRIATDENGYARTKDLPYGTYTVTEAKGADEHKICDPFDVFIGQDGRVYYYVVENTAYFGKVKIVKTDAETGRTIPLPDTEFKVKNTDTGEWVAQEILYPTPIIIDSYLTAPDGTLVMPKPLHFGNYELYEVKAPYGYLLSEQPVPFKVTSENPQEFLEVPMPNKPVKGKVTIRKTGEVLTGATGNHSKNGTIHVPEYRVQGISGATFDIIATEDIITPDGTLRAAQGEVVDTVTTGADGDAVSKELYLGNYHAVETAVPYGFLLDETPLPFSLVYQDQHTALVSAETGLYNERAKGEIALIKTAEEVRLSDDGAAFYVQTPAKDIVFGLYARKDIAGADGGIVIKADSLMDILITGADGKAVSTRDIPFGAYYVRELTTRSNLVPSDTEYDAVFEYQGDKTPLVTIAVNEGNAIENFLVKGRIKVIKTDEDKKPLSGVEFAVTGTATGITAKLTTGEDGEAVTDLLPYDTYTIVETKTQESYVLDGHLHTILLAKDGETYEFGLVNEKIRGRIKVIKTDGKTKTPLEGVVFEVTDANGKAVATITTDKDGIAVTGPLCYGDYTVKEKTAKSGYVLDEVAHEIQIREHEKVYELALANNKIPETPGDADNPKTGDDSNPALWVAIIALSTLGLTLLAALRRRGKKQGKGAKE